MVFSGPSFLPALPPVRIAGPSGRDCVGQQGQKENPLVHFVGLFAGVSEFQFRRCPVQGEQIILQVELTQSLASIYRFAAEAFVGDEKVAGGQILLSFLKNPSGGPERSSAGGSG